MLALGAFHRATLFAHQHGDGDFHLHRISVLGGARLADAVHSDHHGQDHLGVPTDHCPGGFHGGCSDGDLPGDQPVEAPGCMIVVIDAHEQLLTRGTELGKAVPLAVTFAIVALVLPPSPDLALPLGSPGGVFRCGPMSQRSLSAGERLVRTSCALLL